MVREPLTSTIPVASLPEDMRHNQKLDYEQLRSEAEAAVAVSGKKRIEIAEELGVSSGAITRALQETGSKFSELQKRIIEYLTPYVVEETTFFQAKRKDA